MNLLLVAGGVRCDLGGFRSLVAGALELLADLLGARTRGVEVLLAVALDLRRPAPACLDLVPELAKLVRQLGLVNGCRELLCIEQAAGLKGTRRAVLSRRDVEDYGMRVELGRCVAVDRPGSVVLELGNNELPGRLSRIVAADPRLGIPLQFRKRIGYGGPVRFPHPIISTHKRRQRDRLGSRERRIPAGAMLDRGDGASLLRRVLLDLPVLH